MEELIVAVYCCVDDLLKNILKEHPPRQRGFAPSLTDAEVITMEIVGEFQGIDPDKGIWEYFKHHWLDLFPQLKTRTTFTRQAANLWMYKQESQKRLAWKLGGFSDPIHLIDGIPIPLCCITRATRSSNFSAESDYSYCAAKDSYYYGFRGHLVINSSGVITGFTVTTGKGSEREALWEIVSGIEGILIGDKGYISEELKAQLANVGINLQTALRKNMHDKRSPSLVNFLMRIRRLIETVIGQLTERFNIEKVWARDTWHLTNRFNRKILAHTVCLWLNRHSHDPLQFERLLSQ
ncbi:MAG: IS982 family transposase [Hormoscilla sp. GUM202]|nr:IS982 family transposase [Hormoscilla sp. GUM202]